MRFIVYLLTLFFVGTAVAQNPTILQGNYVSNVFGQSNFVLNPNAQTNVANVTVSNATVTRSTTTPLVATSEFLVTTSTATGYADWATRTFDAGMKNQNCEARFTYRGFSVGSTTAQIRQGSNTVAQLTLTPSTDPRIASINFPCGDLSSATTFRLQQATAALTGTNEIGGIYVGLATNMANVAQAEFVGRVTFSTDCLWATSSSTYNSPSDATCTATVIGNVASVAGVKPQLTITDTRPGNYYVVWSGGSLQRNQIATYSFCSTRLSDGTSSVGGYTDPNNMPNQQILSLTGTFQYTTTATRTIALEMKNSDNLNGCAINTSTDNIQFSVYRFPTSSELVVTPETQNVWGGVVYKNQQQSLFIGSAQGSTRSYFNNATWNQPTLLKGKAQVSTTNSGNALGFSIPNLPVGQYKVEISGLMGAGNNSSVTANIDVKCNFYIKETTTSTDVARQAHQDWSVTTSGNEETRDWVNSFSGVFNNTSVATRDFILEAMKFGDATGTNGFCQAFSQTVAGAGLNTNITFLLIPLDQPSNSALYVEGPVKASATGAAISTGYVGQTIQSLQSTFLNMTQGTFTSVTSITLTSGVWLVRANAAVYDNGATYTAYNAACALGNTAADIATNYSVSKAYRFRASMQLNPNNSVNLDEFNGSIGPIIIRSDGTNLYFADGNTMASSSQLVTLACFTQFTSGTMQAGGSIEAVRIN